MFKKIVVGLMVSVFMFGASTVYVQAQTMTLAELVDLFISIGVISKDKAAAARTAVGNAGTTSTVAQAPTTVSTCYTFTRDFGVGSTGGEVVALQKLINQEKGTDGVYDEDVSAAVVKFQAKYGIRQTGYVGPVTRAKLNSVYSCKTPASKKSAITVLSPNGGETWSKGTKQTINWQDSTPLVKYPCEVTSSGITTCPLSDAQRLYDVTLVKYQAPCPAGIECKTEPLLTYPISKGTIGNSYLWYVGENGTFIPDGSYVVQVCQLGTSTCDSSDSAFTIFSLVTPTFPITIMTPKLNDVLTVGVPTRIDWGILGEADSSAIYDIIEFTDSGKGLVAEGITQYQAGCPGYGKSICSYMWTPQYASSDIKIAVAQRNTSNIGYSEYFRIVSNVSASATIDESSLTTSSNMPTLTGSAYNVVQPFGISLSSASGDKVWGSGSISVNNNRWSTTINQSLTPGSYTVNVYSNNVLITSGTLVVTSLVTPSITVLSPNGGEVLVQGAANSIPISWTGQQISGTFAFLVNADSPGNGVGTLGAIGYVSNNYSTLWWDGKTVCQDLSTNNCSTSVSPGNYKIYLVGNVANVSGQTVSDMSDRYFTLSSPIQTAPLFSVVGTPTMTRTSVSSNDTSGVATSTGSATFNVSIAAVGGDITLGAMGSNNSLFSTTLSSSVMVYKNGAPAGSVASITAPGTQGIIAYSVPSSGVEVTNGGWILRKSNTIQVPVTVQFTIAGASSNQYAVKLEGIRWEDGTGPHTSPLSGTTMSIGVSLAGANSGSNLGSVFVGFEDIMRLINVLR